MNRKVYNGKSLTQKVKYCVFASCNNDRDFKVKCWFKCIQAWGRVSLSAVIQEIQFHCRGGLSCAHLSRSFIPNRSKFTSSKYINWICSEANMLYVNLIRSHDTSQWPVSQSQQKLHGIGSCAPFIYLISWSLGSVDFCFESAQNPQLTIFPQCLCYWR